MFPFSGLSYTPSPPLLFKYAVIWAKLCTSLEALSAFWALLVSILLMRCWGSAMLSSYSNRAAELPLISAPKLFRIEAMRASKLAVELSLFRVLASGLSCPSRILTASLVVERPVSPLAIGPLTGVLVRLWLLWFGWLVLRDAAVFSIFRLWSYAHAAGLIDARIVTRLPVECSASLSNHVNKDSR